MKLGLVFLVIALCPLVTHAAESRSSLRMRAMAETAALAEVESSSELEMKGNWFTDIGGLIQNGIQTVQKAVAYNPQDPWPYTCTKPASGSISSFNAWNDAPVQAAALYDNLVGTSQGAAKVGDLATLACGPDTMCGDNLNIAHFFRIGTCLQVLTGAKTAGGVYSATNVLLGFVSGFFHPVIAAVQSCINAVITAINTLTSPSTWLSAATAAADTYEGNIFPPSDLSKWPAYLNMFQTWMAPIQTAISTCSAAIGTTVGFVKALLAAASPSSWVPVPSFSAFPTPSISGSPSIAAAIHYINRAMDACDSTCPTGGTGKWCATTDCSYDMGFWIGLAIWTVIGKPFG